MLSVFTWRSTLLGLVSWAVPFIASFAFFGRDGQLMVSQPLFKSLMVVIFGGLDVWLLVAAFRRIPRSLGNGLALGVWWLAINMVLDLVVLVPATGMPAWGWFEDIGLRYLLIPAMAAALGAVGRGEAGKGGA